ncbi:MAG TPA: hypothetical protein VGK73_08035 [Polyangiaceae bacterium]
MPFAIDGREGERLLLGAAAGAVVPAQRARFGQTNERADDSMEERAELRLDRSDESHRLGGFEAGECFPRRGRRGLKPSLPIPSATVGPLGDIEWDADQSALHLVGETELRARSTRTLGANRRTNSSTTA